MRDDTNTKLKSLEKENFKLGSRIKEVEEQHLYLEAYSRRENLKFENIPENSKAEKIRNWCYVLSSKGNVAMLTRLR